MSVKNFDARVCRRGRFGRNARRKKVVQPIIKDLGIANLCRSMAEVITGTPVLQSEQ